MSIDLSTNPEALGLGPEAMAYSSVMEQATIPGDPVLVQEFMPEGYAIQEDPQPIGRMIVGNADNGPSAGVQAATERAVDEAFGPRDESYLLHAMYGGKEAGEEVRALQEDEGAFGEREITSDKLLSTRTGRFAAGLMGVGGAVGAAALMEAAPAMAAEKGGGKPENTASVKTVNKGGAEITILKLKAKAIDTGGKLAKCLAEAEKEEQPAPPVDPYANCAGGVKVKLMAWAKAKCPKGFYGGAAKAKAVVKQWMHVRAWSQAIASGRAEAKAKTTLRDKVKATARAWVNCIKIKKDKPETPDTSTTTPTPETSQTPPKDGTVGAGSGNTGQEGGSGSGGEAGDGNNGEQCLDANGNVVVGRPADQFGNC